jgi:monoamine oxidase
MCQKRSVELFFTLFSQVQVGMAKEVTIIGAGIAGLTVAAGLLKKGYRVILLERYPNVGGRIVTQRDPVQYEIGAGRIHTSHKRVMNMIRKYKLHTYPISGEIGWMGKEDPVPQRNPFSCWFAPIVQQLQTLPASTLRNHTISELLPDLSFRQFPYWAEVSLMRADIALESFQGEMGTYDNYVGIVEGIDSLTTRLAADVQKAGGILLTRYRVADIKTVRGGYEITGTFGKKAEAHPFLLRTPEVVIATCRCSLSNFSVLKGTPLLQQLQTSPLTRIYAMYPKGRNGRVWFEGLPKVVTDSPLRFVIPINPKTGLIRISYTDGPDTEKWKRLDGKALQTAIQKEVRKVFGAIGYIPEPTYLRKHEWSSGCTYWVPGTYTVESAIKKAMTPRKGLYVVGESISRKQAWIEGALESAEELLTLF